MAHVIKLTDIFLTGEIGYLNMDMTMPEVVDRLNPPDVWNRCGDEVFPTLWTYNGVDLAFESEAPHKLFYIKFKTDHFDGHVSVLTGDSSGHSPALLLLDQEGLMADAKPSDLVQLLTKAGKAHQKEVELEFINIGESVQFHVGYGGNVNATFILDDDEFGLEFMKSTTPEDEEYQYIEIAKRDHPFNLDLDDPTWMKALDEYALLYSIDIGQDGPRSPEWQAKAKRLSGDDYLARIVK